MPAYRRRVPPSTLMHRTSRAPELSATLRRLSCWFMRGSRSSRVSAGALEHFDDAPVLELRQGTGLGDAHAVALAGVVLLIVRVQVARALHRLAVAAVTHAVDDRDDDGLVHLGGHDDALAHLAARRSLGGLLVCHLVPIRSQ